MSTPAQCPDVKFRCLIEAALIALEYANAATVGNLSDELLANLFEQALTAYFDPSVLEHCSGS